MSYGIRVGAGFKERQVGHVVQTGQGVEEFGAAWVRFDNGLNLVFKTSWAMHMNTLGGTFFCGTKGGLRLDPLTLYRDEFGYMTDAAVQHVKGLDFREMFVLEHAAFARAVLEDLPTPVPGDQFLTTQVIIQGLIDSAEAGREVAVHMPET